MPQSVMPALSRALVPEVLPAVMPAVPGTPEFLPAAPAVPVLPALVPVDLPAEGRQALAAAALTPLARYQVPVLGVLEDAPVKTVTVYRQETT